MDRSASKARPVKLVEASDIDAVFAKFTFVWGQKFLASFDGMSLGWVANHGEPMPVKPQWLHELKGVNRNQLAYGLSNLPATDFPPTVIQFRVICRSMPDESRLALPDRSPPKGVPAELRDVVTKLLQPAETNANGEPHRIGVARRYVRMWDGKEGLSPFQQTMLKHQKRIIERWDRPTGTDEDVLRELKEQAQAKTDAALAQQEQTS